MHPLLYQDKNQLPLFTQAEWAVEIRDPMLYKALESERKWDWNRKVQWIKSHHVHLMQYGFLEAQQEPLYMRCNFLKIYSCVVMLYQPAGRFVDYHKMDRSVRQWCQLGDGVKRNWRQMILEIRDEIQMNPPEQNKKPMDVMTFPYGANWLIRVGNDHSVRRLYQLFQDEFEDEPIQVEWLTWTVTRQYGILDMTEKVPLYAEIVVDQINGLIVSFFSNRGNFADFQQLMDRTLSWFPKMKVLTQFEKISQFFKEISTTHLKPDDIFLKKGLR